VSYNIAFFTFEQKKQKTLFKCQQAFQNGNSGENGQINKKTKLKILLESFLI